MESEYKPSKEKKELRKGKLMLKEDPTLQKK